MHRVAAFCVVAVVTFASSAAEADPTAIPGANGTLWVTERAASTVTAFDAGTGAVLGTTSVGAAPIGITQPSGTNKVYSSDENADQLSVIDRETVTVVATIAMGDRPHHLMASPNGRLLYVAEFNTNQIGVVDTDQDVRIGGFVASASPAARTHAVWITRDGKDLYATNSVANTIAKLDATSGTLLWELVIGNNPSEILVTPDGRTAFVSIRNENKVRVVDLSGETPVIVGESVVGTQPDTLSLTNDLKTLVVGLRGTPAQMALVDTDTLAVSQVSLPGTTTGHQWLSANGRFTFIAVESPGGVAVVDNKAGTVVDVYPYPGGSRPHGVFLEPEVQR